MKSSIAVVLVSLVACGGDDDPSLPDAAAHIAEACPPDRDWNPELGLHDARLRRGGARYCVQPPVLFAADVAPMPGIDPLFTRIDALFPEHRFDGGSRTIMPRTAHAGPYAAEAQEGAAAAGFVTGNVFTREQISGDGALFLATVITPERDSPIATPEDGPEGYVLPSARVDALEWHGRVVRNDNGTFVTVGEELFSTATARPLTLSHLPIAIPVKVDAEPGTYAFDLWVDELDIFTGESRGSWELLATFTIQ